jgi:hypothetical protein
MTICDQFLFYKDLTPAQKPLFATLYCTRRKDPTTALVLSLLVGAFGVDRFYAGDLKLGIPKLIAGLLGVAACIGIVFLMNHYGPGRAYAAVPILMSLSVGMLIVLGIWVAVDWFLIMGAVATRNQSLASKCLATAQKALPEDAPTESPAVG